MTLKDRLTLRKLYELGIEVHVLNYRYSTVVGELQFDSGLCRFFTMRIFIVVQSWIPVEAL
uniref:Uncharacterized protein n=1 Tax=Solanum tuberosum TaxID=4113 RepID=M1DJX0_SOLTU